MSIRTAFAAALIALALLVGCEGTPPTPTSEATAVRTATPTHTPAPPTVTPVPPTATSTVLPPLTGSGGGRIAFVSDRDGNSEIYVMNADGTDQRRLTRHPADDWSPVWSPDGTWIAFESNRHGRWGIYVMRAEGEQGSFGVRRLSPRMSEDRDPAWSPPAGGTRIAFSRVGGSGADIHVMDVQDVLQGEPAGDVDARPVTRTAKTVDVYEPAWSPSGTHLAFAVHSHPPGQDDTWTVYVMDVQAVLQNPEGAAPGVIGQRLRQAGGEMESTPAWAPEGPQIAFGVVRDGHWGIQVIDSDGANLWQLPRPSPDLDDRFPAWSPDGTRIAFQSNADGRWDIVVASIPDGTDRQHLTSSDANDTEPDWNP